MRVTIIGLGVIGGSLGLALKLLGKDYQVTGVDLREATLTEARQLGAIDRGTTNWREAVADAEVVVLATPVRTSLRLLPDLGPYLSPGTLVMDVGSTKSLVLEAMARHLPPTVSFIGGHPMTGSERSGLSGADPYLFQNSLFLLTPGPGDQDLALARAKELVAATGARVVIMSPAEHDWTVAAVSHLPYLLAVTLVNTVAALEGERGGLWPFAAGGFRDTTRVASGSPEMWRDIFLSNRTALLQILNHFKRELGRVEEMLAAAREEDLEREFERARENRKKIPATAKGLLPKLHELVIRAEDRPGVIGEIASALGRSAVNISDIEILRVREGEGGTIRLGFTSAEALEKALGILRGLGYWVRPRE